MNVAELLALPSDERLAAWRALPLEERKAFSPDDANRITAAIVDDVEAEQLDRVGRGEPGAPLRLVPSAAARTKRRKANVPPIWIDEAEMPAEQAWLIKGLVGRGDLVMVYGDPGCGKTFFVIDMVAHVATAAAWRGLRTTGGLVVYVAAEAGRSILRRFIAWRDHHLGDAREERVPLAVVPRGVNLLQPIEIEELLDQLRELATAAGKPLAAVVFDTYSRSISGGNENDSADATRAIGACDRIREETGAAVILIHHGGKDKTKGARGHTSLIAAVDASVFIDDRVAKVEKVRDGVTGSTYPFALQVVEIARDADGDAITTCVVVEAQEPEEEPIAGEPRTAGLKKNQQTGLDVLKAMYSSARRTLRERGEEPEEVFIEVSGWRKAVMAKGVDVKRIGEVQKSLVDRGLIRVDFPHVFLAGDAR